MKIPIEVSARHVHLSDADLQKLFGKNYRLKIEKFLSQKGEFAAKEKIELINGKEKLITRVLGPCREKSQAEISITDAHRLKMKKIPQIRVSEDLENTPLIKIKSPKGKAKINVIIAQRHLHISDEEAKKFKLKNNQLIKIKTKGKRTVIFENVIVRVNKNYRLAFHLDTDEANSAGIKNKAFGEILR